MRAVGVDLAAAEQFLGMTTGLAGTLTGDASMVGRLSDPRGRITFSANDLHKDGYKLAAFGCTVDLGDGAANTSLTIQQPDGVVMMVTGRAPLSWLLPAGVLDPSVPSPTWDLSAVSDPINLDIFGLATASVT